MRALKVVLTAVIAAIAVTAGLIVAAGIGLATLVFFAIARMLRGSRVAQKAPPVSGRAAPTQADGVIDVTATEVPADPPTH